MSRILDEFYVALEERFRGSNELIRERQMAYIPLLQRSLRFTRVNGDDSGFFLDIGSGRGEWLQLLDEHDIRARGIDSNSAMVDICRQQQLHVDCGDATEYLSKLPDGCLLGASAFHVVEHLPFEAALRILAELHRCLRPGGVVFFETPNPENVRVGSHTFYIDPTHQRPVPPVLLAFMFEYSGFSGNEIVRLHPPEDFRHRKPLFENTGFLLHHFMCGQDYAVVGVKGDHHAGILPMQQ